MSGSPGKEPLLRCEPRQEGGNRVSENGDKSLTAELCLYPLSSYAVWGFKVIYHPHFHLYTNHCSRVTQVQRGSCIRCEAHVHLTFQKASNQEGFYLLLPFLHQWVGSSHHEHLFAPQASSWTWFNNQFCFKIIRSIGSFLYKQLHWHKFHLLVCWPLMNISEDISTENFGLLDPSPDSPKPQTQRKWKLGRGLWSKEGEEESLRQVEPRSWGNNGRRIKWSV
jgi:hypothetical protein